MIDLGIVRPGSTIRIPFSTFKGSDGSSLTMTNFAAADFLCYKDGSTTERASTSGFTATTDFDSKTGKQLLTIDLSDNTTADFWAAGSEYLIAVDAVTVDAVTTGGWVARFKIGYAGAIHDTTIATLSSQTSFTLTAGPADNNALVGCTVIVHAAASGVQRAIGVVSAYTGSTKTVTLAADPAIYTMAAKDNISFFMPSNDKWLAGTALTGRDIGASVLLSTGTGTGQLDFTSGVVKANVTQFGGTNATSSGGRPEVNTTHAAGTSWGSGAITAASIATDAITAAKIAADAIGASELAADAVAEIQSGLSTLTAAGVRSAVGLASANLDTQLTTIDDFLDTEVAAIKAKTDNLPASPAAVGSAMTLADGAITDAKFTIPSLTGPASGPVGFITQVWRRFFKRVTKSSTQIKTYADDATTVVTTQSYTSSGSDDDVGAAS